MIAPSSLAFSRRATSTAPSAAETSSAESTYPRPTGSIWPWTTALAPTRWASSRARARSSGVPAARPMRPSACPIAAASISRTSGDCVRSTRSASVSEGPSVESAVRFSKSASTRRSRSASTPLATSVPTGPIPSARIAVYAAATRPRAANASTPPVSVLRQVSQPWRPLAGGDATRARARRRSRSPVVTVMGSPTASSPIAPSKTQLGRPSWFVRK